jgi:hypothetical protein
MELYEMTLSNLDSDLGVKAISVVDSPAIEMDFVALNEAKQIIELAEIDKEKKLLLGACLVPNKPILRIDQETGKEFYIYFSSDTIRQISERFLKKGNQNNTTLQHKTMLEGVSVVESWIVESPEKDKSSLYNMSLPIGTWCVSMKCDNDEVYQLAKQGKIKGFSIEGYFNNKPELNLKDLSEKQLDEYINELADIL